MFSTLKQRLILGIYVFLILSIPIGAYLASEHQNIKSKTSEGSKTSESERSIEGSSKPKTSAAKEILSLSQSNLESEDKTGESESSSPTIATSFGPTLSLAVALEGRPKGNQVSKLFVGIVEGVLSQSPRFLLSFTIDLPTSGSYTNLSLAGLTSGTRYTALLKGRGQIATSSAFIMSPTVTNLNDGQVVNLVSGDVNEDNVINSADYSILQKAVGSTSSSSNWLENADFNKDGIINAFDLAVVGKNLGKVGASGSWTSPLLQATPSASLNQQAVGSPEGGQGYWIWIPRN